MLNTYKNRALQWYGHFQRMPKQEWPKRIEMGATKLNTERRGENMGMAMIETLGKVTGWKRSCDVLTVQKKIYFGFYVFIIVIYR